MRLLLDTHALLWWHLDDPRLSQKARRAIADPSNVVYASAVSAFEIATKHRIGKLAGVESMLAAFDADLADENLEMLVVSLSHALMAGRMVGETKDPFDRLLAAQSIIEGMSIVSTDPAFDDLNANRFW